MAINKPAEMHYTALSKLINFSTVSDSLNHNSLPYMERTITPPDMNNSKPPAVANFASAFKSKDLKNASSWSSLAQSSSPQNAMLAANRSADVFQAFKKQAKQNSDRVRFYTQITILKTLYCRRKNVNFDSWFSAKGHPRTARNP